MRAVAVIVVVAVVVVIVLVVVAITIIITSAGIFLTDIVRDRGLTVGQGTQLLMVMYACNVLGRGGVALVKTLCKLSMVPVFGAVLLSCGLSTFTFTLVDYANDGNARVLCSGEGGGGRGEGGVRVV